MADDLPFEEGPETPVQELQSIMFDMEEVHSASVGLLEWLQEEVTDPRLGVVALILTLGRIISPEQPMEVEEEIKFITAGLDFISAYFPKGGVN